MRIAQSSTPDPRVSDLTQALRLIAVHGFDLPSASAAANSHGNPRVQEILRAAVAAGTTADSTWAKPLSAAETAIAAFINSLKSAGIFDAMLPSMLQIPNRTRVVSVTTGATGSSVAEGKPKPISALSLAGASIDELKAVATLICSDELLRSAGELGSQLFQDELRMACAVSTDTGFLAILTAGVTPTGSAGTSLANSRADVAAALNAVQGNAASRYFLLSTPAVAKAWSAKTTAGGEPGFPDLTPQGGSINGTPFLISDGVSSGLLVAVDARQIAAWGGSLQFDSTGQATIQIDSAPADPVLGSTPLTSLWQQNLRALRVERLYGAEKLRVAAVGVVNNIVG